MKMAAWLIITIGLVGCGRGFQAATINKTVNGTNFTSTGNGSDTSADPIVGSQLLAAAGTLNKFLGQVFLNLVKVTNIDFTKASQTVTYNVPMACPAGNCPVGRSPYLVRYLQPAR